MPERCFFNFFFFNDTATTEIYTLSLHDALPICASRTWRACWTTCRTTARPAGRSEEHTSELQSQSNLVCRLLLEKKKKTRPSSPPLTSAAHASTTFLPYIPSCDTARCSASGSTL